MKTFILLIANSILLFSTICYATQPIIQYNVHVMRNTNVSQCTTSWRGKAAPEEVQDYSRIGEYNGISNPGVASCTNCSLDGSSHDCICATCYYYFN